MAVAGRGCQDAVFTSSISGFAIYWIADQRLTMRVHFKHSLIVYRILSLLLWWSLVIHYGEAQIAFNVPCPNVNVVSDFDINKVKSFSLLLGRLFFYSLYCLFFHCKVLRSLV